MAGVGGWRSVSLDLCDTSSNDLFDIGIQLKSFDQKLSVWPIPKNFDAVVVKNAFKGNETKQTKSN